MPRSTKTKVLKTEAEILWLEDLRSRYWEDVPLDSGCLPCKLTYIPQVRSGKLQGTSVIRLLWTAKNSKPLQAGEVLKPTCTTPWCGNPDHWKSTASEAQRLRDLWFSGVYNTRTELVTESGTPYKRWQVNAVLRRARYVNQPLTSAERRCKDFGLLDNKELLTPIDTGTGRIVSPEGTIYPDIRRVELAGYDRREVAKQLNRKNGTWKYEAGEPPQESTAIYWDVPDFEDGQYITKYTYLSGRTSELQNIRDAYDKQ